MRKIHLQMDGNQIAATWDDFGCLEVSPAGFGDTLWKAIGNLIDNTPAKQINGIVSSIENAAVEERASKSVESPGTVPAVAAANKQSDEIKPCGWRNSCGHVRVNKVCKGPTCNIYDPV
jgi:hypothetical protein